MLDHLEDRLAEAKERLPPAARGRGLLAHAPQVQPAASQAATVRSRSGLKATTWSSAIVPLGWGSAWRSSAASADVTGNPSSSPPSKPARPSANRPLPSPVPASRIATEPTTHDSPLRRKPTLPHTSGGSPTWSSVSSATA